MMKNIIITGTAKEIDGSASLAKIVSEANSIQIVNYNIPNQKAKKVFDTQKFQPAVDVVIVYTNNIVIDFVDFLNFYRTDIISIKNNIKYVFLCRTAPFVVNSTLTKFYTVIDAKKDTTEPIDNAVKYYRIESKIQTFEESKKIVKANLEGNYSEDDINLLVGYFNKQINIYDLLKRELMINEIA